MKNLILICSMLMFCGYASAQETPAKTKQSTTKTDTVSGKKNKHTTTKSSTTHTTDTISQRNGQKKGKMKKSSSTPTTSQRRDSVNGTPTRP